MNYPSVSILNKSYFPISMTIIDNESDMVFSSSSSSSSLVQKRKWTKKCDLKAHHPLSSFCYNTFDSHLARLPYLDSVSSSVIAAHNKIANNFDYLLQLTTRKISLYLAFPAPAPKQLNYFWSMEILGTAEDRAVELESEKKTGKLHKEINNEMLTHKTRQDS